MLIIPEIHEMQRWSDSARRDGNRIAFVPTMGALHEGHLTLVDRARQHADLVVASVFVNPAQFGPNEDFDRYPRDLEADAAMLHDRGVAALFAPNRDGMYPDGFRTTVHVAELGGMLEGGARPTHFDGVTLIVTKLFHAVRPDVAVFGRKDAQQAIIIRRMTRDLDFGTEIVVAPTVRERDGLAMSSRNRYLSSEEREAALALPRALKAGFEAYRDGERNARAVVKMMRAIIESEPRVRLDYIDAVSTGSLEPVERLGAGTLAAGAVYVGSTRLLDNWWIDDDGHEEM
jgi:pantoate--beta-alanine ligase